MGRSDAEGRKSSPFLWDVTAERHQAVKVAESVEEPQRPVSTATTSKLKPQTAAATCGSELVLPERLALPFNFSFHYVSLSEVVCLSVSIETARINLVTMVMIVMTELRLDDVLQYSQNAL